VGVLLNVPGFLTTNV